MPGIHRSLRQGRGNEFFQYRPYDPGEDMKVVDWKVFAKREELVAKTFQEDTNFNLFLVLDTSASMGYKGEKSNCTKLHYASMLAACFAYIAFRQGDRVGLFAYGEEVQKRIRPKSGHAHFWKDSQCPWTAQTNFLDFWVKHKTKVSVGSLLGTLTQLLREIWPGTFQATATA